jgi:hypothetical protein
VQKHRSSRKPIQFSKNAAEGERKK